MTIRNFGGIAAVLLLALGSPALAQDSDAPVDVTAAPPPSAETIGPAQLRNFDLKGTVTRPSNQPAATPAQPTDTATARPRSGEAVPSEAAAPAGSHRAPEARRLTVSRSMEQVPTASRSVEDSLVTPSVPLEVTTDPAPQPATVEPGLATELDTGGNMLSWPWIAALIALIGGGAFVAWSRRDRSRRYGDPGRMAFAGLVPDVDQDVEPRSPVSPRPDPVPARTQPRAAAPRPDPVPTPGASAAPKPAGDGTIVSTSLKPKLNVEFKPDRVIVTEEELVIMFDLLIVNSGSAPARDLLVESRLFTAHLGQDRDIATFFQNPAATADRMNSIAPLGKLSLKSMARLPLSDVHKFEAAGRNLFVPLVGLNLLYRYGSSEGQASASYLVGRGSEQDEKLAPFGIDVRPRIFRGLMARPHSLGLQPA